MEVVALIKCLKSLLRAFEGLRGAFLVANSPVYHNGNNKHQILIGGLCDSPYLVHLEGEELGTRDLQKKQTVDTPQTTRDM